MSTQNIVICSTQYPFYGGGGTLAYKLHKYLLNKGVNSYLYYFINRGETEIIEQNESLINPYLYKNVRYVKVKSHDKADMLRFKNFISNKTIYMINYGIIPYIPKDFTGTLNYMVVGSPELTIHDEEATDDISYIQFMKKKIFKRNPLFKKSGSINNKKCIHRSDNVYFTTKITKDLYEKLYSRYTDKFSMSYLEYVIYSNMYAIPPELVYNTVSFNERQFDFIAVSSSWLRYVKNVKFLYNIYSQFPEKKKIIIGTVNSEYDFTKIPNTIVLPLLTNQELHEYYLQSKLFILPSLYENASISILEALHFGCKVLASKNVGMTEILPESIICTDVYDIDEWKYKINNYPDKIIIQNINMEEIGKLENGMKK
jgi:glycosyltransferase involved in cell wall biosynthesis